MLGGMSGQMAISEGWLVILGIFEQFFRHNELSWLLFWINLCMLSSCLLSIAMHLLGKWRETGAASGRRVRGSAWRRWDLLSSQQSLLLLVLSIIHQCLRLSAMYHSVRSEEEKVVLVWKDLTFQTLVKDPKHSTMVKKVYQKRQILKGLSGKAESKQLIAILGPTGCGKTSLLSVLSARFPPGGAGMSSLTGTILLNGRPRDEEHFRKISAYVMQDDHMYAHLTVYETLLMAAHFFLSSSVTDSQKVDIVTTIITELGLLKARDTIIGDEKARGVSGGERKRVSIAVQLLTDPAVLFLDEPTSGLDAFQSQAVMEVLRSLANKGRLVVSVIHQPRSSIYNMFDRLLLLSEGRTMYYGEACLAVKYFTGIGFTCPEHFNPADYFLDLLSPDHRSQELGEETATRINYVGERYLVEEGVTKGGIGKEDDKEGDKGKVVATDNMDIIGEDTEKFVSIRHIGGNEQDFQRSVRTFSLLCWRSWTEQARNLSIIMVKFTVCAFFALIIGGIYSNIGHDQRSIQNRRGVLYFVMINQAFTAIQSVTSTFPNEKAVVSRERAARSYSILEYCLAKVFVEMPLNLLPILVYSVIVHPLIGLNLETFGIYILISMYVSFTITMLGLCISAFAPNADAANAIAPPFLIIGILFGGFYIKISSLPPLLNLIPYVSAFYYGFRGLNIAEFKGQTFSCPSDWDPQECVLTGEEALRQLGMQGETVGDAMFGLSMLVIAYGVALYFLLLANEERYVALGWIGGGWRKYEKETGGESVTEKTGELGVAGEGGENGRGNSYQLLYGDDRQGERVGVAAAQVGVVSENIGAEGDQAAATP